MLYVFTVLGNESWCELLKSFSDLRNYSGTDQVFHWWFAAYLKLWEAKDG